MGIKIQSIFVVTANSSVVHCDNRLGIEEPTHFMCTPFLPIKKSVSGFACGPRELGL
jgi:hypothetical protein